MDFYMEGGDKPSLDWSLVKAYAAGVFTVTIFNRYMFLGGLIGVFTGNKNAIKARLKLTPVCTQEFTHSSSIRQLFQTYSRYGRISKKLSGIHNLARNNKI